MSTSAETSSSTLVERLREPLASEETMRQWDHWRRLMKQTQSSLPRDAFEAWCDQKDEDRSEAAAQIAQITSAAETLANGWLLDARDNPDLCVSPEHHQAICALFEAIAKVKERRP